MALDRWIALFILFAFAIYGYSAFFMMDDLLPPIMQRNPIWPSSFPKLIAIGGILVALVVVAGFEKTDKDPSAMDINYTRLTDYNLVQALALLGFMLAYAFLLRPFGFLLSTFLFLALGSLILGEKRLVVVALVAAIASGSVWYLVDEVLGIFLRPLPAFL